MKALHFGVGIRQEDYSIFALGESETGKDTLIRRFLDKLSIFIILQLDICYVNNFDEIQHCQI